MKKLINKIFLFLLLVTNFGCENNNEPSEIQKTEIIPLELGNYWKYQEGTAFDTIQVIGEDFVKSKRCFDILNGNIVDTRTNKEDGYYAIYYVPPHLDTEWIIFKYLGKINETYAGYFGSATIVSISESISISLGTFKCYKYSFYSSNERGDETQHIDYVSPGIGIIIEEVYFKKIGGNQKLESRKELIKYKIN